MAKAYLLTGLLQHSAAKDPEVMQTTKCLTKGTPNAEMLTKPLESQFTTTSKFESVNSEFEYKRRSSVSQLIVRKDG